MQWMTNRTGFKVKVLFMIAFLVVAVPASYGDSVAAEYKLPKTIYFASRYVGGSLYTVAAIIADKIAPELGVKIRLIPGNDIEMIQMMTSGRAHMACFASDNYWAPMGLETYCTFAMGPQPIRMIWAGVPSDGHVGMATKVSGIKTPHDLKGSRAAHIVGAGWSESGIRATLAFANLTLNDVKVVEVSSSGAAYRALAEGKADWRVGGNTGPKPYEIEASKYGLWVMEYPFANKEGWARMAEIMPYWAPGYCTYGAGMGGRKKVEIAAYPYPIINVTTDTSEEFAYRICKSIHKGLDAIVAANPINESMRMEVANTPDCTLMTAYHPGAVKFFKEIGFWTQKHEAANQARLEHLRKVSVRWEEYIAEAEAKMKKTGKKINPKKEWPAIVEKEVGLRPK